MRHVCMRIRSPGPNADPRRWSMFIQSGVVGGSSRLLSAAWAPATTDHACAWAAASPARYRASSSSKAASMSSRSNSTRAAIRLSASISTTPSTSVWNASGRWSRPAKRARLRARRSPRVAMTVDVDVRRPRRRRWPACLRSRHLGRVGRRALTTRRRSSIEMSSASISRHRVPVARREARPEALDYLACRVFQPRCRPTEFVESRERGVEVGLVE